MKRLLLATVSSITFFISIEANAQLCNYNKGNAVLRDQNNLCAPSDVNWNIYYYGLNKTKTNEVVINWGDGTAPQVATLVDVTGSDPAANRKWEVTVPHTYPKDQGYCNYDAVVNLSVNGVQCPAEAIQRQTIIVWDTDDVLGLGLLTDVAEHQVCAGNSASVTFTDVTEFTCLSDEDPNNLGRWVQWEYGTASTITGNVKVGGQTRSFPFAETPVWFDRTATASNVITQTISVPNTSLTGEYFEVTLHNWNSCNPYEVNGVLTGNLPVSKKVYIRIIDAPNASFSVNPNPACVNNSIAFNNTSTSGLQYAWDFGDGTTSTTKNPTKTYSAAGNYTVTLTVTNNLITGNTGTCFKTVSKQIDILPQPVASFTIDPAAAQCANTAVNITNTSANVPAGTAWNWEIRKSSTTTGQRVNLNGGNIPSYAAPTQDIVTSLPYFGTAATARYYIRLIANTPNQCTNTSAWQTIEVKANVGTPTFTAPLTSRCQGAATTQYTATASYAENGYDWALSPAGAGTINNSGLVTWNAGFTGTATVQVTAKGCGTDRPQTVNVNVTPVVGNPTAITGAMEICQGTASGTYTTSAPSATSYTWTITGAGNTIIGTTTSATVNWAPNFTGDATITVVAQGCNSSSTPLSATIKVKPTPQLSNPAADYALTICSGQTATFTPAAAVNGSSFKWTTTIVGAITGVTDVGDNKLIGTDNISDVLVNSGTTSGKVTYHIIPFKDGCEGARKDFTVIVMPGKPDNAGAIAGTNDLCEKETGINYNVPSIHNGSSKFKQLKLRTGRVQVL